MAYTDNRSFNAKNSGNFNRNNDRGFNKPEIPNTLPKGYLESDYLRSDGRRDTRYVLEFAEHIGKVLSADANTGKSKIRAYYDTALSIKDSVYNKAITEDEAIIRLSQLKNRVIDRQAKGNASPFFVKFISKNVDTVISDEDKFRERIRHFCEHFEAVVCHTADKKERR